MECEDDLILSSNKYRERELKHILVKDWERYNRGSRWWAHVLSKEYASPALFTRTLISLVFAILGLSFALSWLYTGTIWNSDMSNSKMLLCNLDTGYSANSSAPSNTTVYLTDVLGGLPGTIYAQFIVGAVGNRLGIEQFTDENACSSDSLKANNQIYAIAIIPAGFSDTFSSYFSGTNPLQMSVNVYSDLGLGLVASSQVNYIVTQSLTAAWMSFANRVYSASIQNATFASILNYKLLTAGVLANFSEPNTAETSFAVEFATIVLPVVAWLSAAASMAVLVRYVTINVKFTFISVTLCALVGGMFFLFFGGLQATLAWLVPITNPQFKAISTPFTMGASFGFMLYLIITFGVLHLLLAKIVGVRQVPVLSYFLLCLQVVSCGVYYPTSSQNVFFNIGKAFPMYYAVREFRSIFYGVYNDTTTTNNLVIMGWLLGSFLIYMIAAKFWRVEFYGRVRNMFFEVLNDLSN